MKPLKSPDEVARKITEMVASEAFKLFRDKKFRRSSLLETFDQTEQDRIFNEIVVSGLSLAVLMFEALSERAKDKKEISQYYAELQMESASRYGNWLKEMGTPPALADMWKGLINMRVDEYRKDYRKYKRELSDDKAKGNPWVFVVAIGGHNHLRRGKGKPEDELLKIFLRWVCSIAEKISRELIS
jgi:hypothetical protein